jgi:hypothetical protein
VLSIILPLFLSSITFEATPLRCQGRRLSCLLLNPRSRERGDSSLVPLVFASGKKTSRVRPCGSSTAFRRKGGRSRAKRSLRVEFSPIPGEMYSGQSVKKRARCLLIQRGSSGKLLGFGHVRERSKVSRIACFGFQPKPIHRLPSWQWHHINSVDGKTAKWG